MPDFDIRFTQLPKQHRSLVITKQQEASALHTTLPATNALCFLHYSDVFTLSTATHAHSWLRNIQFMSTHFPHVHSTYIASYAHSCTVCVSPAIRATPNTAWRWLVGLARLFARRLLLLSFSLVPIVTSRCLVCSFYLRLVPSVTMFILKEFYAPTYKRVCNFQFNFTSITSFSGQQGKHYTIIKQPRILPNMILTSFVLGSYQIYCDWIVLIY
jgi:hypothetical protein